MTGLAQTRDGLEPTEDLFDPFALLLTYRVTGMAGGTCVDNAGRLACDVGSDPMVAQFLDEGFAVIALVGTHGHPSPACDLFHQLKGRLGFGAPGRLVDTRSHRQALAIVHPHVPGVAELASLPAALRARRASGSVLD